MKKSICLFTAEFPYGLQETFLENELDYLSRDFEKIYIVPLFKHSTLREITHFNIEVMTPVNNSRSITVHKSILLFHPTFWKVLVLGVRDIGICPNRFFKVLKQAFIVTRMRKYIAKRPKLCASDIWYFYWGTNSISVLPFLQKHPAAVARYHGYDLYGGDIRKGEVQVFQEQIARQLKRAFFISENGYTYFNQKKISEVETEVSKLGVPDRGESRKSEDGVLRIATCSNLYPVKRTHLVAEALKEIKDIKIEWTHFGDGPRDCKMKLFFQVADLGDNVSFKFAGRVRNSKVIQHYKEHPVDLFINVSESEGLPVSIMEALSFGIPVIATNVGGTSELVNSENGALLDPHFSPSVLAEKISRFYSKDYQSEQKRLKSRESWEQNVNSCVNYPEFVNSLQQI